MWNYVKMLKRCQNVKKMSNVKKWNTKTMDKVDKKKLISRGSHIFDVNFLSQIKIVQKHFLSKC